LCFDWRWEFDDNHFKKYISSIKPFLKDKFEQWFTLHFFLIILEGDLEGVEHLPYSFFVVVHNVTAESDDWFHYELNKHSLESSSIIGNLI